MIKTENEYQGALSRLQQDLEVIARQTEAMREMKLTDEQIQHALQPSLSFHEQLKEEVEAYEKIRRGDFAPISNLGQIGQLLVGLRIYLNLSQSDLATKLGVSQAAISKDERNEYHGITVERAQRILEAMGITFTLALEEPLPRVVNG